MTKHHPGHTPNHSSPPPDQASHRPETFASEHGQEGGLSYETTLALLNASSDAAVLCDTRGTVLALNHTAARRLGVPVHDITGRDILRFFPPALAESRRSSMNQALETGSRVCFEDERAGLILQNTIQPVKDAAGTIIQLAAFSRDVTEQRRLERELRRSRDDLEVLIQNRTRELVETNESLRGEVRDHLATQAALRDSERRFRNMFDGSRAVMLLIDPSTGNIVDANPAACEFYGHEPHLLRGMNISRLNILPHDEITRKMTLALEERCNHFHFRHTLASGEIRDVTVHSSPIDFSGTTLLHSIIHDVTNEKRIEERLRRNHALLESVFTSVHSLIAVLDPNRGLIRINRPFAALLNVSPESAHGRDFFDFCHDATVREAFDSVLRSGTPHEAQEEPLGFGTGTGDLQRYWDWSLQPLKMEHGETEGYIFNAVETTGRVLTRTALQAERDKLTSIFHALRDCVYIVDRDFDIEYVNPVVEREFGPHGNRKCYDYFHPGRTEPCPWCENEHIFRGQRSTRIQTFLDTRKTYEIHDTPLRNADGTVSKLGILHDLTDLLDYQARMHLDEARLQALFELSQMADATVPEIGQFALGHAVGLTRSASGFIRLLDEEESECPPLALYGEIAGACGTREAPNPDIPGILWKKVIESREPLLLNTAQSFRTLYREPDRQVSDHPARALVLPVFEGTRIVAVACVIDKPTDYDASDTRQLTLLMHGMWGLIRRRRTEEEARGAEHRLRFLSSKLLTVQEDERAMVAQELHDTVGQTLVAIKYRIEKALRTTGKGKAQSMSHSLQAIIPLIQDALSDARRIYMDLRPTVLDDFGIIAALRWFCAEFERKCTNLSIETRFDISEDQVPERLRVPIFRIAQEALKNSFEHGKSTAVTVTLAARGTGIELIVEDNGVGFQPPGAAPEGDALHDHIGMAYMRERVRISDGTFSISTPPGGGITIRAAWDGAEQAR